MSRLHPLNAILISFCFVGLAAHTLRSAQQEIPSAFTAALSPPADVTVTEPLSHRPDSATGRHRATLGNGLKSTILRQGTGAKPKHGQLVFVHCTGSLMDGKKFDSTRDHGEPIMFELGYDTLGLGWDEAIARMKVGTTARLDISPSMAHRIAGVPPALPTNEGVTYEVEIMRIEGNPHGGFPIMEHCYAGAH